MSGLYETWQTNQRVNLGQCPICDDILHIVAASDYNQTHIARHWTDRLERWGDKLIYPHDDI